MVDLAGSERQTKTGATGERLKAGVKSNGLVTGSEETIVGRVRLFPSHFFETKLDFLQTEPHGSRLFEPGHPVWFDFTPG